MHCIKYAKIQVFTDPYSAVFYAVMVGHFSQVATTSADIEKVKKKGNPHGLSYILAKILKNRCYPKALENTIF